MEHLIERRDRIAREVPIPDAPDLKSKRTQIRVSRRIMRFASRHAMPGAVKLNDKRSLFAEKIWSIGSERNLAFEFQPAKLTVSNFRPEAPFKQRRI